MGRVFASYTGGLWIKFRVGPYFLYRNKTSEYSEYCEELTSEHFLLYNYRSSTLPGISQNIGRLLRQCNARLWPFRPFGIGSSKSFIYGDGNF